jgi:hypothetical protein
MTRLVPSRLRPPWTLLACALVLAVVLGVEWMHFGGAAPAASQAAAHPAPPNAAGMELASFAPAPPARYDEVTARPLFLPDRRPQLQAEPAKPPLPPPAFRIQGVVLSPERRSAIVEHGNPPKLDSVTEGATIEGWRVESIGRDRVSLRAGAASAEIPVGDPGQRPNARAPVRNRNPNANPHGGLAPPEE